MTTVVAKVSFALGSDGIALGTELPELRDDPAGSAERFSDLVPGKGAPELLVVGHARAAEPASRIEVAIRVGDIDKRVWAMGNQPSQVIPLAPAFLRAAQGEATALGPRYEPPVSWGDRTYEGTSFNGFNSAPVDQRSRRPFAAGDRLAVRGVGTDFEGRLPATRPWVVCRDDDGVRLVDLACDTVWLDADRARLEMVWRGRVEGQDVEADWFADLGSSAPSPAAVVARWGPPPAQASDATAELSVADLVPGRLPFGVGGRAPAPGPEAPTPPASDPGGTAELDLGTLAAAGLPFAPHEPPVAEEAPEAEPSSPASDPSATAELDLSTLGQAVSLPFRGQTQVPAPAELPEAADSGATLEIPTPSPEQIPFALRHRAPRPPAPGTVVDAVPAEKPPVSAPPPRTLHRLPLEQHAGVLAARLDGAPLDAALAEFELDEMVWRRSDRAYRIAMAREDGGTLTRELEAATRVQREARLRVSAPAPEVDLDTYVSTRVELEEADDPIAVLRQLGLDEAAWRRLRRHWTRRALADASLRERLEQALRSARRRLRRLSGEP